MSQNFHDILQSPYLTIVALLLLAVVVVLLLRQTKSANRTIASLAKTIGEQKSQISVLESRLRAEIDRCEAMAQRRAKTAAMAVQKAMEGKSLDGLDDIDEAEDLGEGEDGVVFKDFTLPDRLSGSDEDLLKAFFANINENISDINLSTDVIAADMCMSRSNLFRKIKQITGIGPNEHIRIIRLKRAAQMLQEGRLSIADICMLVGFNSPSYFSSCFKKHYGCLPKDYK